MSAQDQHGCSADTRAALFAAYVGGFNLSGEGWNGEYPYADRDKDPTEDLRDHFDVWLAFHPEVLDFDGEVRG